MKDVNLTKYALAHFFISFFWGIVAGIIISLTGKTHNSVFNGATIFFVGTVISSIVFGRAVKKGKMTWFLKQGIDNGEKKNGGQ